MTVNHNSAELLLGTISIGQCLVRIVLPNVDMRRHQRVVSVIYIITVPQLYRYQKSIILRELYRSVRFIVLSFTQFQTQHTLVIN